MTTLEIILLVFGIYLFIGLIRAILTPNQEDFWDFITDILMFDLIVDICEEIFEDEYMDLD